MLIVGDNLKELCTQHGLVDRPEAFDVTSLTLRLHQRFVKVSTTAVVDYGKPLKKEWIEEGDIPAEGLELGKNMGVLCCSEESIKMPAGYFGLVQTKGSLARLFISATCNDGQIDSGYSGRITFEMVNQGRLKVRIPPLSSVAELFIFRTSTNRIPLYSGRYQGADKPTIYTPQ